MTHTSTEQAEARDLAYWIAHTTDNPTAALIQSLHARVQELKASQARVPLTVQQYKDLHHQLFMKLGRKPLTDEMHLARAVEQFHGITQEKQG